MKILVIGNGFDIAHDLPTKYKQFLDFIKEQGDDKFFTDEVKNMAQDNIWMQHFKGIADLTGDNWIDFESEISRVIKDIESENMYDFVESYFSQPKQLWNTPDIEKNKLVLFKKKMNKRYGGDKGQVRFSELRDKLVKDLNMLQILLDKYLGYILDRDEVAPLEHIQSLRPDAVLSFNYTDTYQRVYDRAGKVRYDYIHGRITDVGQEPEGRIVLGINEHLDDCEKNSCLEYIEFKKYFQRIFKGTGLSYKDWLEEMEEEYTNSVQRAEYFETKGPDYIQEIPTYFPNNQVVFYGHSLDVTDKDILRELILPEYVYCTFYYHDENALKSQITNLVKIIGQDELIKRTGGFNAKIKFRQIPKDSN